MIGACGTAETFDASIARCVCVSNAARSSSVVSSATAAAGSADAGSAAGASSGGCTCVPAGFYWDAAAASCTACPRGATCVGSGLFSSANSWRASAADPATFSCCLKER